MQAAILLCGYLLDCLFGDPLGLPQLVVGIGKAIARADGLLRAALPKTQQGDRLAGMLLEAGSAWVGEGG